MIDQALVQKSRDAIHITLHHTTDRELRTTDQNGIELVTVCGWLARY